MLGIRPLVGFLQAVIRVTACTSRTLGFLSKMRAGGTCLGIVGGLACSKVKRRRCGPGYRFFNGLRRNKAAALSNWVSTFRWLPQGW